MARVLGIPSPTAGSAAPARKTRTLARTYRRFAEVDAAETSPLYERVAVALSESDEALRAIEAAPARKWHPTVILAALHDLALALGKTVTNSGTLSDRDGNTVSVDAPDPTTGALIGTVTKLNNRV